MSLPHSEASGAGGRVSAPGAASTAGAASYPGDYTGPLRPDYAPKPDGRPDPGEIVWTWVPFEEDHSQGKDRPVLVVAREAEGTLLAVQLSSKAHNGDRAWVPLGSGPWDRSGRDSWVNVDRVLRLDDVAEAHRVVEASEHVGKVLLLVGD